MMRLPVVLLTLLLASVLFGYQVGMLPMLMNQFHVSYLSQDTQSGLLVMALPCLAAVFSALGGWMSDTLGRRFLLTLGIVLLTLGGLESAVTESLSELVIGRVLVGAGIGLVGVMVPLYLVELAPFQQRGQWIAYYVLAMNIGVFFAYLLGGVFAHENQWRLVACLGALPGIAVYIACFFLPESPRWLLFNKHQGKASQVFIKLFGSKRAMKIINQMDAVDHRDIYQNVSFWSVHGLRILLVGLVIHLFSQALGFHAIISYSTFILSRMNFQDSFVQLIATIFFAFVLMFSAFLSVHMIDTIPRRRLLLSGLGGMIAGLVLITWSLHNLAPSAVQDWLVLAGAVFFIVSQGCSLTPLANLLPAEIFPQSLRGCGLGLSVAAGWACNLIIVNSFPRMLMQDGADLSFVVFLLFAMVAWVWCYLNVPETTQLSLEQIETLMHEQPGESDILDVAESVG